MSRPATASAAERYLPLSGVAFTGLMVLGAAAFPMPPGGDVSAASHPGWLASHYNAVIAQSYVRAFAAVAFLVLTAAVASACRRALPDKSTLPGLALVGGAFSGGLVLISQAVGLGAALFAHAAGNASATKALGQLQDGFLDMSAIPAILLFAAVGITAFRSGLLPRWFAVVNLAGVPFALVDSLSYDGGPFEPVGLLGLLYFLAWSLLTGVHLTRSHRADTTLATTSETAFAS